MQVGTADGSKRIGTPVTFRLRLKGRRCQEPKVADNTGQRFIRDDGLT